jgi:hypothetical protein
MTTTIASLTKQFGIYNTSLLSAEAHKGDISSIASTPIKRFNVEKVMASPATLPMTQDRYDPKAEAEHLLPKSIPEIVVKT